MQTALPKQTAYSWASLRTLVKWNDLCFHWLKTDSLHHELGETRPEENLNQVFKAVEWSTLSNEL